MCLTASHSLSASLLGWVSTVAFGDFQDPGFPSSLPPNEDTWGVPYRRTGRSTVTFRHGDASHSRVTAIEQSVPYRPTVGTGRSFNNRPDRCRPDRQNRLYYFGDMRFVNDPTRRRCLSPVRSAVTALVHHGCDRHRRLATDPTVASAAHPTVAGVALMYGAWYLVTHGPDAHVGGRRTGGAGCSVVRLWGRDGAVHCRHQAHWRAVQSTDRVPPVHLPTVW
jgi:hypothetical protein